jgi:hypothetical protein
LASGTIPAIFRTNGAATAAEFASMNFLRVKFVSVIISSFLFSFLQVNSDEYFRPIVARFIKTGHTGLASQGFVQEFVQLVSKLSDSILAQHIPADKQETTGEKERQSCIPHLPL